MAITGDILLPTEEMIMSCFGKRIADSAVQVLAVGYDFTTPLKQD
jgi:hypothetical protein